MSQAWRTGPPHGGSVETGAKWAFGALVAVWIVGALMSAHPTTPVRVLSPQAVSQLTAEAKQVRDAFLAQHGWTPMQVVAARNRPVDIRNALGDNEAVQRDADDVVGAAFAAIEHLPQATTRERIASMTEDQNLREALTDHPPSATSAPSRGRRACARSPATTTSRTAAVHGAWRARCPTGARA